MQSHKLKNIFKVTGSRPATKSETNDDIDKNKGHSFKVKPVKGSTNDEIDSDINTHKYQLKIKELESIIRVKDSEIERLKKELDKLRSVVKGPIHAESYRHSDLSGLEQITSTYDTLQYKFPKDALTSKRILNSLSDNVYMRNLDKDQLAELVNAMFIKLFSKDEYILKEGESGDCLFLVEEGTLELSKGDELIGTLGVGKAFGEHSFLYGCNRTTTVKAISDGKLWVLTKSVFEQIMLNTMIVRQRVYLDLLNKVPLFNEIPDYNLCKVIDILREVKYLASQVIYMQGNKGETLFIIKQGAVEFYRKITSNSQPSLLKVMSQGSFFGERSLLGEEYYNNDARAGPNGCILLQIERDAFSTFIGSISGLRNEFKTEEQRNTNATPESTHISIPPNEQSSSTVTSIDNVIYVNGQKFDIIKRLTLDSLVTVTTLGVGSFSRTELVVPKADSRVSFALKQMKKKNIVMLNLQNNILNEKRILSELNSNFIIKLFRTFRDRKYVYFLLEACQGGDLKRLIIERQCLSDEAGRFYLGSVVEAIKHLHKLGIVYRDLKPSNILIDDRGYCKMSNFTFAKKIQFGRKTFSFCGTPEYVAPEVILNKGHDFAVDYWGLGILLFEILSGKPPFSGGDPIKTYNMIMKGFDAVRFPATINRNAQALIRKLCRPNPVERIGYTKNNMIEIQKNKWFDGFEWMDLRNMIMNAPIIPQIKDSNEGYDEDEFPRDDDIPPDETSGWDKDF